MAKKIRSAKVCAAADKARAAETSKETLKAKRDAAIKKIHDKYDAIIAEQETDERNCREIVSDYAAEHEAEFGADGVGELTTGKTLVIRKKNVNPSILPDDETKSEKDVVKFLLEKYATYDERINHGLKIKGWEVAKKQLSSDLAAGRITAAELKELGLKSERLATIELEDDPDSATLAA